MALIVNSTPLDPLCNSYASIAEGDDYVLTRVADADVQTAWDALTDDLKALYLVNSSRALDSYAEWIGDRYTRDQGLKWPRINAVVDGWLVDSVTFPPAVVQATIEMALWFMDNSGETSVSTNNQFDSIKVGPINIDFNEASGTPTQLYFPEVVVMLLKDYGGVTQPDMPSSNKLKQVRLVRA